MSVGAVKAVSIAGMLSELDKVIQYCGDSGVFHPDDAREFYPDAYSFVPLTEKNNCAVPLQNLKDAADAAGIPLEYVDTANAGKTNEEILEYAEAVTAQLEKMADQRQKVLQEKESCARRIRQIERFTGSELDLKALMDCRFVVPVFGRLPNESFEKISKLTDDPNIMFVTCSEDANNHWGIYFAPADRKEEVDRTFTSLFFEPVEVPPGEETPETYLEKLHQQLSGLEEDHNRIEQTIRDFVAASGQELMECYTKLDELNSYYTIRRYIFKRKRYFILVGWIPSERAEEFKAELEEIHSVECTLTSGKDELKHSPPVCLKNPPFFRIYEYYVKMYGLPNYNEIDPTPFVALTYTLFFGIMFGDMGQGLVVALVGALMWKLKKMEVGRILIPCGLMGAVFGFFYGSVFGFEHWLDPIHQKLFGTEGKLFEVMEPDSINLIIYGSVALGVVTITITMLVNIVSSLRRKDYESAFFGANGVAGFVLYVSLAVGLVCTMFLNIPLMNTAYILGLIVLPLILMFLREPLGRLVSGSKNWQPEKWGEYCMQSFFELFEMCLSYVTNTMSFLRIGAYILVHTGMMMVVSTLAEMVGGPVGYIAVVIIGNGIVMALEALLVAIQVLRLDYYEIFSRFYIGEGRQFKPVVAHAQDE